MTTTTKKAKGDVELTADAIFAAEDVLLERVDVPEWGGYLFVKGLTGAERDAFERDSVQMRGKIRELNLQNFRARLIAACARNSAGELLFRKDQVDELGKKSARALQRVFAKAQDLSGFGEDEVEELTQELGKDPNDDSGSGLRLP